MAQRLNRIIEHAIIGDGIGPVSAAELIAAPTLEWELWRRMITDAHQERPKRDIARCLKCESPVFIQTRQIGGKKRPLFVHYAGADITCPWFTGKTTHPNEARAAQYQGRQESIAHRQLCNLIAELAAQDARTIEVKVDDYLPPNENSFGRYPDVLIRWNGFPDIAIEIQLSRTFQTEISARCLHYDRERMPLIWILCGVDLDSDSIAQSFRDVLSRHQMNAFLIDRDAVAASKNSQTLILSCRLALQEGGFELPQLIHLDKLIFPDIGLPYLDDRLTPSLVEPAKALRKPWFAALTARSPSDRGSHIDVSQAQWTAAFEILSNNSPSLSDWLTKNPYNKQQFASLVAVSFSIVTHAQDKFRNFATAQDTISAMLNSRLSSEAVGPYARFLRVLIERSKSASIIKGSVDNHLKRATAKFDGQLCGENDPEWEAMAKLLPEIFSDRLRAELTSIGAMPPWTT